MDCFTFDSIGKDDVIWLERAFEEDKVFVVVKAPNSDKALGHDGFTTTSFQACWDVLKVDIMNVFHDFHARSLFEKTFYPTFITFIPKKHRVVDITIFILLA